MNQFDLTFGTVALAAATAKTVAGVKASANVCLKNLETCITFDGATSSNAPAVVDLCSTTFATNGPGTNSTSITPTKRDPGRAETIQATAAKNWSAEPTVITVIRTFDPAQYNGFYHYINPFASPYVIAGGGGMSLRANSPNVVNCSGHMTCEE